MNFKKVFALHVRLTLFATFLGLCAFSSIAYAQAPATAVTTDITNGPMTGKPIGAVLPAPTAIDATT